jgi:hypothetical protein
MKIYFGCGLDKKDGYINVDIRREVNPDLVWVYGGQDYPENTHKSGFTIPTLKRLLESHGFIVKDIHNDGGTNLICIVRKK